MRYYPGLQINFCNQGQPYILGRTVIPLWQRNYYEHIIRKDVELNRIREYIQRNPLNGQLDRENPQSTGNDPLDVDIFG